MTTENRLKKLNSPIYAFFHLPPETKYEGGRSKEVFECAAKPCVCRGGKYVTRYLDTKDAQSTSNLRRHAKTCWGAESVEMACLTKDKVEAHEKVVKKIMRNGSLPAMFEFEGKGKKLYSHQRLDRLHTRQVTLS